MPVEGRVMHLDKGKFKVFITDLDGMHLTGAK